MGQKPSTPSASSRLPLYQAASDHDHRNVMNSHMPIPHYQQHPERTSVSIGRENSHQSNNASVNLRLLLNDNSNPQSNSTKISTRMSVRGSSDNSGRNWQPEIPPSRSPPVYRASVSSSKMKVKKLQRPAPDISIHTPVAINTSLPKHVAVVTKMVSGGNNDLSNEESLSPLQLTCTSASKAAVDCKPEKPIQFRCTTSCEERKKDLVVNFLYPDLSEGSKLMCNDNSCVQEAPAVNDSDTFCTQNKGQTSVMVKSINKSVFDGVYSNRCGQRIRNSRKPQRAGRHNFHPRNTRRDYNFQPTAPELSDDDSYSFSKITENSVEKSNSQFNEKIFVENVEVILNMLDGVNLETLNDVTKIMLEKLHDKLIQLHNQKVSDVSGGEFLSKEFSSDSPYHGEGIAAEISHQKLEPEELFSSLHIVNARCTRKELLRKTNEDDDRCGEDHENEDKLSEEEKAGGKKANVQHVFGDIYFCCVCEKDMYGQEAAASHNCREDSSSYMCKMDVDDKGVHQSCPSDVMQADTRVDIQQMWQEVNKAQKGRWYNISRLRDGTYRCLTCNVSVGSTHNVIDHVRQRDHQQILLQKRLEETAEERLWRQVPLKYKFNKQHFVVMKLGDDDIFMCKVCVCNVSITFNGLMSHIQAKEHVEEVRKLRRK